MWKYSFIVGESVKSGVIPNKGCKTMINKDEKPVGIIWIDHRIIEIESAKLLLTPQIKIEIV